MFKTIQGRMVAIFVGFILLIAGGGAASYLILTQQADDGLVVNLAGRQRMLTQKMSKESLQLANAMAVSDAAAVAASRDGLSQTVRVFESTLFALKDGGPAPLNLEMTRMRQTPAAASGELKAQLEKVSQLWVPFKKNLQAIISSSGADSSAVAAVAASNLPLLKEMNSAVTIMQGESEAKVRTLYLIQSAALMLGFVLVGVGGWMARTSISGPISELSEAAQMMSTGNLNVEFTLSGTQEIQALGASFDRMRASMLATCGAGGGLDDDI